jgi:hypothetical protein
MRRMIKKISSAAVLAIGILTAAACTGGGDMTEDARPNPGGEGRGIVFFQTADFDAVTAFYRDRVGSSVWLDQGVCLILRHGNQLFGFCRGAEAETCGTLTFFYRTAAEVDTMYEKFKDVAVSEPRENTNFKIYHFYARDPENRSVEFQAFLHPVDWDIL